ncbi:MAG: phosphoribosyltransferase family protein [Candidatus Gottesmanbacteria bacterium]
MDIQYLPITWVTYHDLARKLAATILSHSSGINQIVAISRGGLTLGHLLSDFLRVPIATFTIQSYTDIQIQGELTITEPLKTRINGKHVLLVDDVADSGKTLIRATTYLKRFKPASIRVVTMFYKPHSTYRPDFFATNTTKWILFPYEPTEMILQITKGMQEKGQSKAEIQQLLTHLGYTENQIRFVRKYFMS